MRTVYYLAMITLAGMLIWGQLAAKSWQEIAEDAQNAAVETAKRANACFDELQTASTDEEEDERSPEANTQ